MLGFEAVNLVLVQVTLILVQYSQYSVHISSLSALSHLDTILEYNMSRFKEKARGNMNTCHKAF